MNTAHSIPQMFRGDYSDEFTDTNATLLDGHTPPGEWHLPPYVIGDREPQINTNALRGTNPSGGPTDQNTTYLAPNMHSSNCWIEMTHYSLFQLNNTLNPTIGSEDVDNFVAIVCSGSGSGGIRLSKTEAGTRTDSAGVRGQGGADYVYRIEKVGDVYELFIDDGGGFASEGTETYTHIGIGMTRMGISQRGDASGGGATSQLITSFRCGSLPPFE